MERPPTPIPIYTIGYGSRSIAELIEVLHQHEIAYLIDVRSAPYSRYKPEFSKAQLANQLEQHGIRYVFMGDTLGGRPDDETCYVNGKLDYEKVKEREYYQRGIERLHTAFLQQRSVVLMCSEGKPEECHRCKLIGATLTTQDIPVIHIDENGEQVTQEKVIERLTGGQLSMFGDAPTRPDDVIPTSPSTRTQTPLDILKNVFGHAQFRPLQKDIIDHILKGQDALIVLPTGGGKSLCYQLPALLFDGVTVVVSPLVSLMQDQVMQLQNRRIRAAFLNHTVRDREYVTTMQEVRENKIKLLYLAPETLVRPEILVMLDEADVACLAIDEAHCISEWGHDFRPEYRQLVSIRARFQNAVCVALTATATPRVQDDIKKLLKFGDGNQFTASFDRENLFIAVEPKVELLEQTFAFLNTHREGSGIIYCQTKKQVESLCRSLTARRISALPYHADLDSETRKQNQDSFINGDTRVIVATIAFGMGIDKADVRFVLHAGLPKEPESYYQEIGRSGRDGLPANCLLLFSYGDVDTIEYFINQGASSERQGRQERLQTLVSWATSIACRRKVLLAYFGEEYENQNCGMCDNCRNSEMERIDLTTSAQKFLSCVLRTGQLFGEAYIIDVLRGSQQKKILNNGHDRISTHGIGTDYSKTQWRYLSLQFLQHKLLARDARHGSLRVTEKGWGVLNGDDPFLGLPVASDGIEVSNTSETAPEASNAYAPELFEQLRNKRKMIAEAEDVPAFVVFSDRTLREIAIHFPKTEAEFLQIHGVGPAKVEKYAEVFLPIIREYCKEHEILEQS